MRFAVRLAPLVCLVATGCGFAQKPYADDPLLRGGRAVWLAREAAPPATLPPSPPIVPPRPPLTPTSPRWE